MAKGKKARAKGKKGHKGLAKPGTRPAVPAAGDGAVNGCVGDEEQQQQQQQQQQQEQSAPFHEPVGSSDGAHEPQDTNGNNNSVDGATDETRGRGGLPEDDIYNSAAPSRFGLSNAGASSAAATGPLAEPQPTGAGELAVLAHGRAATSSAEKLLPVVEAATTPAVTTPAVMAEAAPDATAPAAPTGNASYGTLAGAAAAKPAPSEQSSANDTRDASETTSLLKQYVAPISAIPAASPGQAQDVEAQAQPAPVEGLPEVRKKMKWIFPALAIGVFLSAADQTIIASAAPKIGSDLDALNKTSWIATAYFLTLTSFQPLYGKLSDIFSRKSCLLFAYTVFGLGCLFCGLAQDINQLILARAFAGVGGGGMTTVVSIILSDAIPLQERGTWQGYINIVFAAGSGIGAPMGGLLADSIGWRASFYMQAPMCLVCFVAVAAILRLPRTETEHWRLKLGRIDFLGAFVLVSAVFCLLFGLDRGSNVAWSDKAAYIPVAVSVPLFALFIVVESKIAKDPFAPGHIILSRALIGPYLCNFFAFAGWIASVFALPLYFQAVTGISSARAGLLLLPGVLCGVTGSLAGGLFMQKTGRYYWITVAAYSLLFTGGVIILLASGLLIDSIPLMMVGTSIGGIGNGIGVTTTLIALIASAAREDQAVVTACSYLFRSLGAATGISLASTAANQILRDGLWEKLGHGPAVDKLIQEVRQNLDVIRTLKPALRDVVRECYRTSAHAAFGVQIALLAGAAIAVWSLKETRLSR